METYNTQVLSAREDGAIIRAVELLVAGSLVAVPTETVYGLAADALNDVAVANIYAAKGRPPNNPLICHVATIPMAERYVVVPDIAKHLMQQYWPGPLTFVLPKREDCPIANTVSAGLDTLAVRCPDCDITRGIIAALDKPIAAPSANPSGALSPTCAADVLAGLAGKIPLIIDGGSTDVGIESTIIGITNDQLTLLRPGSIAADEITAYSGQAVYDRSDDVITAPGQLKSHYAPNAPVRLNVVQKQAGEILIGFGDVESDLNLSPDANLEEAAHNLFALLRRADSEGATTIAVSPVPMKGIGIAINDRLARAAAPRGRP